MSHGVDRSIHGGINERKEIDPNNRGSIVIGSVAFYLDRAGYDVLPLALGMLQGETVPPARTTVDTSARHGGQRLHRVSALRHELSPSPSATGSAGRRREVDPLDTLPRSPSGLPRRSGFHADSR